MKYVVYGLARLTNGENNTKDYFVLGLEKSFSFKKDAIHYIEGKVKDYEITKLGISRFVIMKTYYSESDEIFNQ